MDQIEQFWVFLHVFFPCSRVKLYPGIWEKKKKVAVQWWPTGAVFLFSTSQQVIYAYKATDFQFPSY